MAMSSNWWEGGDILKAMNEILAHYGESRRLNRYDNEYCRSGPVHMSMVLINNAAVVLYDEVHDCYYAIERGISYYGGKDYHRSTKGSFKRCKAAFEKYSPVSMARLRQ